MSDPRKGKSALIGSRSRRTQGTPLETAFDVFYTAKRAEGVRERTLADYRSYWRYFREWLEKYRPEVADVHQITTEVIRAYVGYLSHDHTRYEDDPHRKKDGRRLSPVTVASRLRALQTMGKFWESEGLTEVDPAAKVKPPRKDTEEKSVFTDEQLAALLAAPNRHTYVGRRDRTLMLLLADSGLRINEALGLMVDMLDFNARCIRLPGALNKNRKPRIVPLSAPVLRELAHLIDETAAYFQTDYVFVSNYGDVLKPDHFRKLLRKYAEAAGIDTKKTQVSPHRFRDYFITSYLLNGGDVFTLRRIVAHADIKTTQGYVKINEGAMRDSHAQFSPISRLNGGRKRV